MSEIQTRSRRAGERFDENGNAWCSRCKAYVPVDQFAQHRGDEAGISRWCRTCRTAAAAKPEARARTRAAARLRYSQMPEKWLPSRLKKYGLTVDQYEDEKARTGGLCEICGAVPTKNGQPIEPAIDHDHETGEYRGLLCNTHNFGLGLFGDSVDLLLAAVSYLEARS